MIKIFRAEQVRDADNYTILNEPVSSLDLMERAATLCTKRIIEICKKKTEIFIFAGPGNNGGDGLVIARLLFLKNYKVRVYILNFADKFSDDFRANLSKMKETGFSNIYDITEPEELPEIKKNDTVIDAIFGSGLSRKIKGLPGEVIKNLNNQKGLKISIDIPSGLFGEENHKEEQTVFKADYTLTFQFPFLSFFFPENGQYVGKFIAIPIGIHPEFIKKTESDYFYVEKKDIRIPKRLKFSHKGTYGHTLIIAGSYKKAGACILASKAAHRAGAGLVTALVPHCNYEITHIASPETMLEIDEEEFFCANLPENLNFSSIAVGPGIGFQNSTKLLIENLLKNYNKPIIFDADAITILSKNENLLQFIPQNSIFTPHPKEFERFAGKAENNFRRLMLQKEFSKKNKCFVVLKGANTSISTPEGKIFFNPTGNPGMATGGSGDVLTGIIAGILCQGFTPEEACVYGVYLHGLAGDSAAKKYGEYSTIASDICDCLPKAFKKCMKN